MNHLNMPRTGLSQTGLDLQDGAWVGRDHHLDAAFQDVLDFSPLPHFMMRLSESVKLN
jgi:hypothetical protein